MPLSVTPGLPPAARFPARGICEGELGPQGQAPTCATRCGGGACVVVPASPSAACTHPGHPALREGRCPGSPAASLPLPGGQAPSPPQEDPNLGGSSQPCNLYSSGPTRVAAAPHGRPARCFGSEGTSAGTCTPPACVRGRPSLPARRAAPPPGRLSVGGQRQGRLEALPFKPRAPEAVSQQRRHRKWMQPAAAGGRLRSCLARPAGRRCCGRRRRSGSGWPGAASGLPMGRGRPGR